jgi:serine/threonine-protein kinase
MSSSCDERGPVNLLADEFLARCKRGEKPTIKEYCERHPDLADEIRDVFEAVLMVEDLKPGSEDASISYSGSAQTNGKRLQQVGDYRILCEIGRGGMGVVYEAEQQALGRRVALKVLPKTSTGDGSAQIRFQREARAAARMHHTNIVPVFDVGQEGDHLYYAMQLIHGQGLDLVIDDLKRLRAQSTSTPATDRAAPDRSIAASLVAGQFAKENLAAAGLDDPDATDAYEGSAPSSAMFPGQSAISTATTNRRGYFRSVAQIGLQMAGALSYAHSRGIIHRDIKPGNLILDTTGNAWVTDFGLAKTGDSAMTHTGDILGTIRYMAPERFRGQCDVRADVYALGMTLYELLTLKAAYSSRDRLKLIELIRDSEAESPRSIDTRIPLDLETIVMKAIDKDPKRRYQSADEMGEDLQRFVNDEPIKARRVGQVERFTRWCRRNPVVAGLIVAVLLLMATGTAVSSWQAIRATRAREDLAKKNAELAAEQAKVEARNQELAAEQAKVQARFDMAIKAIETFHTGVSEDMLLKNAEFKELRTKLLREAAGFYAELERLLEGQIDVKSRKTLAEGYYQLATLTDQIGDQKEALASHQNGLAIRRELAAAPGADVETRLAAARSLYVTGTLLRNTGDPAAALSAFEELRDLAAALETESPTDRVRELVGFGHHGIGLALMAMGKSAEALDALRTSSAILEPLAIASPAVTRFQSDLAMSLDNVGTTLNRSGKPALGLESFRKATDILEKLAKAHPANTSIQSHLATTYNNSGIVLMETGKPEEAITTWRKGLAVQQKIVDAHPAVTQNQVLLAYSHCNMGIVLARTGKPAEALKEFQAGLTIFQKLAAAHPTDREHQSDVAWGINRIGRVHARQKKFTEAFAAFERGLPIVQKLVDAGPKHSGDIDVLASGHAFRGWAHIHSGHPAEAAADLRRAVALWEKLKDLESEKRFELSRALALLAGLGADAKSGVTKDETKAFADQAVAALRVTVNGGWNWPSELKEPDFDAVRGRADFQKLVAEVEAKAERLQVAK